MVGWTQNISDIHASDNKVFCRLPFRQISTRLRSTKISCGVTFACERHLHPRSALCANTMDDKPQQVKAFRVRAGSEGRLVAEDFFDKLHNAEHPEKRKGRKPLQLQHVFSQCGMSNTFLIYLVDKATPNFVEAVVKYVLGSSFSTTCISERTRNESFLPVERQTNKTKTSTIEREASTTAGGDPSAGFILVDETHKVVYSCNDQGRLEKGNPEQRGARIDVGFASDAPQVRLIALRGKIRLQKEK